MEALYTLDSDRFDVWVKGEETKSGTGGALMALVTNAYPDLEFISMININSLMFGLSSGEKHDEWRYAQRETYFTKYMVHIVLKFYSDKKGFRYTATLYPPVHKAGRTPPVEISSMIFKTEKPKYIAFVSSQAKVYWAISDAVPPQDLQKKPRDGGWSDWQVESCNQPCDGGLGVHVRYCSNPPPSTQGRGCRGPRRRWGVCNDRPCGMVSVETEEVIRDIIINRNMSVNMQESDRALSFKCRKGKAYQSVIKESPNAIFYWQHKSGRYFQNNTGRFSLPGAWQVPHVYVNRRDDLVVTSSSPE